MKPIADIALMAVVMLGLMALGNTRFAWLLVNADRKLIHSG